MTEVKIKIEYNEFEEDGEKVLEIRFLRGGADNLIHNVFYNIEGLSDQEITELKKEAVAKFSSVFPELSFEEIMKGFDACDPKLRKMYKETFGS